MTFGFLALVGLALFAWFALPGLTREAVVLGLVALVLLGMCVGPPPP